MSTERKYNTFSAELGVQKNDDGGYKWAARVFGCDQWSTGKASISEALDEAISLHEAMMDKREAMMSERLRLRALLTRLKRFANWTIPRQENK